MGPKEIRGKKEKREGKKEEKKKKGKGRKGEKEKGEEGEKREKGEKRKREKKTGRERPNFSSVLAGGFYYFWEVELFCEGGKMEQRRDPASHCSDGMHWCLLLVAGLASTQSTLLLVEVCLWGLHGWGRAEGRAGSLLWAPL